MGIVEKIRLSLIQWLSRYDASTRAGARIPPAEDVSIRDGLNLQMPILLPPHLHRASEQQQAAYAESVVKAAIEAGQMQFDPPYRDGTSAPITMPVEDPLEEWDAATREHIISNTHSAYDRNPIAGRSVKYFAFAVVGEGFNLSCQNPDVEEILNDFIDNPDNQLRIYERQAPIDLLCDGELLLRLYRGSGNTRGQVVIAPMKPWECVDIPVKDGMWTRPLRYMFSTSQNKKFAVQPKDMLHVTINRRTYENRGRPELYSVLPWLRAHKIWLEDRARQNHLRGAVLFDVSIDTQNAGVIEGKRGQYATAPTSGSIVVHSAKETWQVLQNPVDAGGAAEDGRQLKLMVAVGMGLPEFYLSDGENANLATATAQSVPALMTFQDLQFALVEKLYYPLFRLVIKEAIASGRLSEEVLAYDTAGNQQYAETDEEDAPEDGSQREPLMIKALDAFEVSYAPVDAGSNLLQVAQAFAIASQNEWASKQAAQIALRLDPDIENDRMRRERAADDERARDRMAKGLQNPPLQPPPANEAPGANGANPNAPEPNPQEPEPENAAQPT